MRAEDCGCRPLQLTHSTYLPRERMCEPCRALTEVRHNASIAERTAARERLAALPPAAIVAAEAVIAMADPGNDYSWDDLA